MNHNISIIVKETMDKIITKIETNVETNAKNDTNATNKKNVSFFDFNDIIIVEPINDTEYYPNKRELWWSKFECFYFLKNSRDEVLQFMHHYKNNTNIDLSVKDAIHLLYQEL